MQNIAVEGQSSGRCSPFLVGSPSLGCASTTYIPGTILVVEDDMGWRLVLEFLLQHYCDEIVTMHTAEQGLEYLQNFSKNVFLILSDIELPGLSGLEFLSTIKNHNHFKKIPLILQSGSLELTAKEAVALGAHSYLCKPYNKEKLYRAINQINFNERCGVT